MIFTLTIKGLKMRIFLVENAID